MKTFRMKNLLACGSIAACALLTACGDDSSVEIQADQVRPPAEAVAPPGSGVKLGSNNDNAPASRPKSE